MLHFISWKQFLLALLILLICYYTVIALIYYSVDLKKIINVNFFKNIKRLTSFKSDSENAKEFESPHFQTQYGQEVSDFIADVKRITNEKAYFNHTNEGLLNNLHSYLSAAPTFLKADKDFRNDINNLIVSSCMLRLATESGKEAIDNLWETSEGKL